ncbi:MAG: DMT family transporter [Myxococcaceae bacterium]
MSQLSHRAAHLVLHVTVLLWGFTAILGRSITLHALPLVFYRLWGVVLVMGTLVLLSRGKRPSGERILKLFGVGVLVALHWWLFYASIKVAGVAVAVLCLSSITFFTAIFEPIVFKRAVRPYELALGAGVVAGVVLLVQLEQRGDARGWLIGLGSALFSSAFGALNGKLASHEEPAQLTFYELTGAAILISILCFAFGDFAPPSQVSLKDAGLLLVLVVACTVFPWLWSLRVLRVLSPYTLALAVALEPVYSMVMAVMLWPETEKLSMRFYVGSALLISLNPLNAWLKKRFDPSVRQPAADELSVPPQ